jgi:hypothetical protein
VSSHAGGSSEKRKTKLRIAAKKRRHEAIQRAAPKALNPYGSDESDVEDDAGPGAPLLLHLFRVEPSALVENVMHVFDLLWRCDYRLTALTLHTP